MTRRPDPAPTLFLGGPWHGERRETFGLATIIAPVIMPPRMVDYATAARDRRHPGYTPRGSFDDGPTTVRYVRQRVSFRRAEKVVHIFAPAGWTPTDLDYALACWIEAGA